MEIAINAVAGRSTSAASRTLVLKHEGDGHSWVVRADVGDQDAPGTSVATQSGVSARASSGVPTGASSGSPASVRAVIIKCRPLNTLSRRLKARLGLGHADQQWKGAAELLRIGVSTGVPLLAAWARIDGVACELLVLEYVPGRTLLELMRESRRGTLALNVEHALADAVGAQVWAMIAAGVVNRDHKPSNIVVREEAARDLALIDCVGVRRGGPLSLKRMLASLVIEPTGCGVLPRRALLARGLRSCVREKLRQVPADMLEPLGHSTAHAQATHAGWRQAWRVVEGLVRAHGDPRPKSDPLA